MSVRLHIDRVIVDRDVIGGEGTRDLGEALERELARVLAAPEAIAALSRLGVVDSLSPLAMSAAQPGLEGLGARIAATLGHGLGVAAAPRGTATSSRTPSTGGASR